MSWHGRVLHLVFQLLRVFWITFSLSEYTIYIKKYEILLCHHKQIYGEEKTGMKNMILSQWWHYKINNFFFCAQIWWWWWSVQVAKFFNKNKIDSHNPSLAGQHIHLCIKEVRWRLESNHKVQTWNDTFWFVSKAL